MDLRISETADQVGVTPATIRNYVNTFGEYLSPSATQDTRKRFTPRDVATLKEIRRLVKSGFPYYDIPDQLPARGVVVEETATVEGPQLEPEPPDHETPSAMEKFNPLAEFYKMHRETIETKDELIAELRKDKERMENRIENLENQIKESRRPWWRRF